MPSKPMSFPDNKKSSYAKQVEQSSLEGNFAYVPVPGPEGPRGPKGDPGQNGKDGRDGKDGKPGKNGRDGVDGISYVPKHEQEPGWARYWSNNTIDHKLGATKGDDGWVSIYMKPTNKVEDWLPKNSNSLYNVDTRRVSTKELRLGSQVEIVYNIEITTFVANTELWMRSIFPQTEYSNTSYVAQIKYPNTYEITVTHVLDLSSSADKISGIIPQIRTDMDAIGSLKSLKVSVF